MVLFHERVMVAFASPKIDGSIVVLLIRTKKRVVLQKPAPLPRFARPQLAVGHIDPHIRWFDLEKNHVDEHKNVMGL